MRLSVEYSSLVFIAVLGVLQIIAARNSLNGISFFKHRAYNYTFGAAAVIFSLSGLFTWNGRNATGIIQGSEQAGQFVLSMIVAVILTLALSSLINHSRLGPHGTPQEGLDILKEMTYLQALRRLFKRRP